MQTFVPLQRVKLLSFVLAVLLFVVGVVAASAQPVRIAVGAASVASLPTWVAQDGGYFAREGVPAELIYIRGGPQTMSALISGEVPFAQIYGGALVAAGLTGADVVIVAGLINSAVLFDRHDQRNRQTRRSARQENRHQHLRLGDGFCAALGAKKMGHQGG